FSGVTLQFTSQISLKKPAAPLLTNIDFELFLEEIEKEENQLLLHAKILPFHQSQIAQQEIKEKIKILKEKIGEMKHFDGSSEKFSQVIKKELFDLRLFFANFSSANETFKADSHFTREDKAKSPANIRLKA